MENNGWVEMTLGDFVSLQRGHDLPEPQRRPGKVPILGSFGVTGSHDTALARGPGVTIGRSGASFGVVSFSRVDYWPLNTALYVTDFKGNDERFVERVAPLHARVVANLKECATLAALRDALLPKLISGELRVPEAAARVEEAETP